MRRRHTTIRIHLHAEAKSTIIINEHFFRKIYLSHFMRKGYVCEASWSLNRLQHVVPKFLTIATLLSHSTELLNRGSWGPKPSVRSWFSLPQAATRTPTVAPGYIIDTHLLPVGVAISSNLTRPRLRLYLDISDRIHMFLDWRLGRRSICYRSS